MLVVIDVYGAKTELGNLIIVCKLNSFSSFVFIFILVLSVPNKNPSGSITAALPKDLSLYMINAINKSAVSDPLKFDGKFTKYSFNKFPP